MTDWRCIECGNPPYSRYNVCEKHLKAAIDKATKGANEDQQNTIKRTRSSSKPESCDKCKGTGQLDINVSGYSYTGPCNACKATGIAPKPDEASEAEQG